MAIQGSAALPPEELSGEASGDETGDEADNEGGDGPTTFEAQRVWASRLRSHRRRPAAALDPMSGTEHSEHSSTGDSDSNELESYASPTKSDNGESAPQDRPNSFLFSPPFNMQVRDRRIRCSDSRRLMKQALTKHCSHC